MVVIFEVPLLDGSVITRVIGECQTITYSVHNEKMPVRVLGDMNPKAYVFGNRTIAGSMVFTVFDEHWSNDMIAEYKKNMESSGHVLDDELPPINVTISMANEYGDKSHLALYGVTFVNEGQVMSINDIYTENTFQFYAKDVDYLKSERDKNDKGFVEEEDLTSRINDLNEPGDSPIDSPTLPENETEQVDNGEATTPPETNPEDAYDNNFGDNREEAISKVNEVYENFKKDLQEKLDSGKITKKEYKELEKKGKKAWKKRKKEIDKHFKKKEESP